MPDCDMPDGDAIKAYARAKAGTDALQARIAFLMQRGEHQPKPAPKRRRTVFKLTGEHAAIARVCELADISFGELIGNCRSPDLVRARWAVSLAMMNDGWSWVMIARAIRRDNSTVRYGIKRGRALLLTDAGFAALCRKVAG